ncbi:transmembrane channel-like protein isoform X1 [Drosophila gunungcola]|uniref:transmembrane channel-like protein isoform X1 n=1 Tax=Drosophila gunungcola TaxID=103775 RepID=UPI0022E7E501|nr:transmembrane channel-like protein isoform X1 [Drosophila gunungcola]
MQDEAETSGTGAGAGAGTAAPGLSNSDSVQSPPAPAPRRPKPGILRLDIGKPRRSSGGSVDFRCVGSSSSNGNGNTNSNVATGANSENNSGVTSPHQLSVTWAPPCDLNRGGWQMQSSADAKREFYKGQRGRRAASQEDHRSYELNDFPLQNQSSDAESSHHEPHFVQHPPGIGFENGGGGSGGGDVDVDVDDEEDYSISVSAIMQRRASVRGYRGKRGSRSSRRASSPMDHVLDSVERRRSSVYTTSSEEGTNQESTQEQIFENIRLHKEVIQSVKLQPWPIRKKLKLVRQAKTYVARHEGALQERFAMSRSTRDLWARFKILMAARWRHWKRETTSFLTVLIPWELRIKEIESHFGSGVASYFTFLRWLMWVNIMIAIPLVAFVIGPEYFATKHGETDPRKRMSDPEARVAGNLFTFWEFEGYLKYSPMFYGYYSSTSGISTSGYKLPLAYFLTAVLVYIYSFVATLRKMAENSRNSKLSSKDDECVFSWKLFTGWDFMIGHAETAHNRIASVVVGFKEALLEEAEKKKDNRNWRVILQRILVNILVMGLLGLSGATVVLLVNHSEDLAKHDNWLSRNAVNVTMTLLSFFLPMIFEALGLFENWHPRQQLRLQLARIMILNMLNLYSLMFSFIYKINSKEKPLQMLKMENETNTMELRNLLSSIEALKAMTPSPSLFSETTSDGLFDENNGSTTDGIFSTTAAAALISTTVQRLKCYNMTVKCSKPRTIFNAKNLATTLMVFNLTTPAMVPTLPTTLPSTIPSTLRTWTTTKATTPTTTSPWTTLPPLTTTSEATTTTERATIATAAPTTATILTTTAEMNNLQTHQLIWQLRATILPTSSTTKLTSTTSTTEKPKSDDNLFYTTGEDEGSYDYGSDEPNASASDATSDAPENSNYSDITDYSSAPSDTEDFDEQESTDQVNDPLAKVLEQVDEEESKSRRKRAVGDPHFWRSSKYSRRHRNDSAVTASQAGETTEAGSATPSRWPNYWPPYRPTTPSTTTTKRPLTGILSKEEWENRRRLRNRQTTSTSTSTTTTTTTRRPWRRLPTTSTTEEDVFTTESTSSESTTFESSSSSSSSSSTTEEDEFSSTEGSVKTTYYIGNVDLSEFGSTSYYDEDSESLEECVITICPKGDDIFGSTTESADGTTPSGDSKQLTTVKLTPLEQKQKRLKEVQLAIKKIQTNLTTMCWETSLGQELSKVIVFDGLMSIVAPLCIDFLRALFVRYVNQNWCWDMEKTFPQYGDFKIAENILTLINNQGQVWMGIFFSPGLVLINLVKLMIMMYFRSWIVLTCNVPHEVVFKASKSNNFYLSLLLTMLFLCVLPVGYAIVWLRPSWHCGPFSEYNRIAEFITNTTRNALPKQLHEPLDYMTSSSTVIPLLLLLILIIYYLVSLTGALREANQDLRTQLQKEREEERKKIFKVPEVKQAEPTATTLTNRWRKVLEASSPVTPTQAPDFDTEEYKNQARKELISRIMKKALRKGSATSDEDSFVRRDDDDTDTEHQDSLPHDEEAKDKRFGLSRLQQIRRTRKPSLVDIVQIAKQERARTGSIVAGTSSAGPTGNFPLKETHPKSRFKVEKHERKDRGSMKEKKDTKHKQPQPQPHPHPHSHPPPYESPKDNEHDPDTNSRIVNERRASLLRRNQKQAEEEPTTPELPPQTPTSRDKEAEPSAEESRPETPPLAKSKFHIVDEKRPPQEVEDKPLPPAKESESGRGGSLGKFKFRKNKFKSNSAVAKPEPEVFKFDERCAEKSTDVPATLAAEHLHSELSGGEEPDRSLPSPTPSQGQGQGQGHHQRQLSVLSRQGRKKIGNLLALVREAVNLKKDDAEQGSDESPGPTTPTYLAYTPPPPPSVLSSVSSSTALEMPPTPEPESPTPSAPLHFGSSTSSRPPTKPPKPPKPPVVPASATAPTATMDDLEELDMPGPITFPKRSDSHRRRTMRQDSQSSIWSDNIPTITISTTGSDECIVDAATPQNGLPESRSTSPGPTVNIIKIDIEKEQGQ